MAFFLIKFRSHKEFQMIDFKFISYTFKNIDDLDLQRGLFAVNDQGSINLKVVCHLYFFHTSLRILYNTIK